MTLDTIFDMASLTKVIVTTTAILQLVDQHKLDLDTPVAHYLPAFAPNAPDPSHPAAKAGGPASAHAPPAPGNLRSPSASS